MCEIVLAEEQRDVVGWEGQGGSDESGRFVSLGKHTTARPTLLMIH